MSLFNKGLDWGKYQETQFKVLQSIEDSLNKTLGMLTTQSNMMSNTDANISHMLHAAEVTAKNIEIMTREWTNNAIEFKSAMTESRASVKSFTSGLESSSSSMEKFRKDIESSGATMSSKINTTSDSIDNLNKVIESVSNPPTVIDSNPDNTGGNIADNLEITADIFNSGLESSSENIESFSKDVKSSGKSLSNILSNIGSMLTAAGKEADKLSAASNEMIRLSGMSGEAVRGFRSEIMDVVADLNMDTGWLYSPIESYQQIISWSQGVTSNLDAIQEMARPLLLTSETLDVNITSVAELFNRFYVRYSFTSTHMEEALNNIKDNTAGNSATAEATMKNIDTLRGFLEYNIKDPDELAARLEEVSNFTSYFESMGIDSGPFAELIKKIAWGDPDQEIMTLLGNSGLSLQTATSMARTGEYDELAYALMQSMYKTFNTWDGTANMLAPLKNIGLDEDLVLDVRNLMANGNFVTYDEWAEMQKNNPDKAADAIQSAEDKYVSMQDKISHHVEGIYSILADWQERLGFGATDIGTLLSSVANLGVTTMIGKKLFGGGGGTGGPGLFSKLMTGGEGFSTAAGLGSGQAGSVALGEGLKVGGLVGGLAQGGAGLTGGLASGGLAAGVGAAGALGGAAMIGAGGNILYDTAKNWSESSDTDKGVGLATGIGAVAGGGMLGAAALGLASGPVGWAGLAIGGIALLGKSIYDNATELTGNAKEVQAELESLEDSLQKENAERLSNALDLENAFKKETDLDKKKKLLEEAGIAKKSELQGMEEEQMLALIEQYKNASINLQSATEGLINHAKRIATGEVEKQTGDFLYSLQQYDVENNQEQAMAALSQLKMDSHADDNLVAKINDKMSDGRITQAEWNDLIYGGADAYMWWEDNNMKKKGVDVTTMNRMSAALGMDADYSEIDYSKATQLAHDYMSAFTDEEKQAALDAIKKSGIPYEDMQTLFGEQLAGLGLEIPAYADGINKVPRDTLAYIHEGEAVVPKKYNPAVNSYESRLLAEEIERSQEEATDATTAYLVEFIKEVKEVRKFLTKWKSDNDKKDTTNKYKNKSTNTVSGFIQQYMPLEF